MSKMLDIAGRKFGRLTVVAQQGYHVRKSGGRQSVFACLCDCGTWLSVVGSQLTNGMRKSCGCQKREKTIARNSANATHRMTHTSVWNIWHGMRQRCYNPRNKDYRNYGGRGIQVCDSWHVFENFYRDMGDRPAGASIDRIDNNGDYRPANCRWATGREQRLNQRERGRNEKGQYT